MPKRTASADALLINPVSARARPSFVPHGLLYISSCAIKRGYSVAIYDRNVDDENVEEVVLRLKPKTVGLGCLTGTSISDAILVSNKIRQLNRAIKIVWGGVHTTLYPDSVLRNDYVDFVVIGDGEHAFSDLLDYVNKRREKLDCIPNIGYKEGGLLKYTARNFVDLDALPQPAWHLINVENYIRRKFYADRVITINTSRGCPYKCSFCCVPQVHLGKWRGLKAERIMDNLQYLKERYKIDGFQVDDDEFDIDRNRVIKLCEMLRSSRLNLKWSHFSRINIAREDMFRLEKDSGLRLVEFGVESGSARMLKFLNKGQTVEQVTNVFRMCKKLKIRTSALFMIGLPTEGKDDVSATVRLVKRLNPHISICTMYRPYPGTELFNYCIENKLFSYDERLENVSGIYEKTVNTSRIDTKLLIKIKSHFDGNNIYQEAKAIILGMNFRLLFYYLRFYIFRRAKG